MGGIFGCVGCKGIDKVFEQCIDKSRGKHSILCLQDPRTSIGLQYHLHNVNTYTFLDDLVVTLFSDGNPSALCEALGEAYTTKGLQGLFSLLNSSHITSDFSMALYDLQRRILILASDQFNIRKLYYSSLKSGGLIYSSSLKHIVSTLREVGVLQKLLTDRDLNIHAIQVYFSYGIPPLTSTPISGVYKVPPASLLVFREGDLSPKPLECPSYFLIKSTMDAESAIIKESYKLLFRAVEKRARGDGRNYVLLSGGLDSSLICAILKKIVSQQNIVGVNVSYANFYSELSKARMVSDQLGIELIESEADLNYERLLVMFKKSLSYLDEPISRSSFLSRYIAFDTLRRHAEEVFVGEGGDELFLGYEQTFGLSPWIWHDNKFPPHIIASKFPSLLRKSTILLQKLDLSRFSSNLSLFNRRLNILANINNPNYALLLETSINEGTSLKRLFNHFLASNKKNHVVEEYLLAKVRRSYMSDAVSKLSLLLLFTLMQSDVTVDENISSRMGIKIKLPFLDYNLAKYALSIPPRNRIKNNITKFILRSIADRYGLLPKEIIYQKKSGFSQPVKSLLTDSGGFIRIVQPSVSNLRSRLIKNVTSKILRGKNAILWEMAAVLVNWLDSLYEV